MTQEEKQLLLQDICARLPYGVKVELHDEVYTLLGYFDDFVMLTSNTPMGQQTNIANIKPYLRPMSSMTDEEIDRMWDIYESGPASESSVAVAEYLYERHLDCHSLIEKGLALEAPKDMYVFKN